MKLKTSKGFTLIELLVVVAIISLLSSVVMAALNDARARARDTRRMEDLRQINTALQLYLQDHEEAPVLSWDNMTGFSSSKDSDWNELQTQLSPYIKSLPKDPLNGKDINMYQPWNENYSIASTYRYYYRRTDMNSFNWCAEHADNSPNCTDKRGYILDTTFEKRTKPSLPISLQFFGINYAQF
ncbi:MAG: hypothetical protein RLY43_1629 [Bacteroidota bacterium]|jgi:prepilin-type N-terminal cleavage/methylation domain-containing protein